MELLHTAEAYTGKDKTESETVKNLECLWVYVNLNPYNLCVCLCNLFISGSYGLH